MRSPESSVVTRSSPQQAVTSAYVECAAAAGYAILKAAWALGNTFVARSTVGLANIATPARIAGMARLRCHGPDRAAPARRHAHEVIAGDPFHLLTPAIYIYVYTCFCVFGVTFAITAWRTRRPAAAPVSAHQPRTHRSPTALMHPWRTDDQHGP